MKWLLRTIYKDGGTQICEFDQYQELAARRHELETPECTAVRFETYKLEEITERVTAWKTTEVT